MQEGPERGRSRGLPRGCGLWISSQGTSSPHSHGHLKSGFQCGAPGRLGAALVEEDLGFGIPPHTHTHIPRLVNFRTGDRSRFPPPSPMETWKRGKAGLLMAGFRSQEVTPPPSPRASCLLF